MANDNGYRSEANRLNNKTNYKDLNLTKYPVILDTRKNNTNMRGFVNIGESESPPDYVMAEYMNAALDAIMAIERTLGTTPMVWFDAKSEEINNLIETRTVDARITRIEDGLFDERYGGSGWINVPHRPVLNNHKHDGKKIEGSQNPPQINLKEDVTDLLPHKNIDLNYSTGLTGAHISVSPSNSIKIADALADFLSKREGGTVTGNVAFTGVVKTRTSMDATAVDIRNKGQSALKTDNQATVGRALSTSSTTAQRSLFVIEADEKKHMLFGRYVLGVRLKKTRASSKSTNLLEFSLGEAKMQVQDNEVLNKYRTMHFVYEHDETNKDKPLSLIKNFTEDQAEIMVDSYYITPIHPATLDR